jgi:hypothetical protein
MTHGTGVLATIVAPHAALASACVRLLPLLLADVRALLLAAACVRVLVLLLPPPPLAIRLPRGAS